MFYNEIFVDVLFESCAGEEKVVACLHNESCCMFA